MKPYFEHVAEIIKVTKTEHCCFDPVNRYLFETHQLNPFLKYLKQSCTHLPVILITLKGFKPEVLTNNLHKHFQKQSITALYSR